MLRRILWVLTALLATLGCGAGATSTLRTLGTASGQGAARLVVVNKSASIINNLHISKTSRVKKAPRAAFEEGSLQQDQLWRGDLLKRSGLEVGGRLEVPPLAPGRYDVRVVDRDRRTQHVAGLKLRAGGRYELLLGEGSFRNPR